MLTITIRAQTRKPTIQNNSLCAFLLKCFWAASMAPRILTGRIMICSPYGRDSICWFLLYMPMDYSRSRASRSLRIIRRASLYTSKHRYSSAPWLAKACIISIHRRSKIFSMCIFWGCKFAALLCIRSFHLSASEYIRSKWIFGLMKRIKMKYLAIRKAWWIKVHRSWLTTKGYRQITNTLNKFWILVLVWTANQSEWGSWDPEALQNRTLWVRYQKKINTLILMQETKNDKEEFSGNSRSLQCSTWSGPFQSSTSKRW